MDDMLFTLGGEEPINSDVDMMDYLPEGDYIPSDEVAIDRGNLKADDVDILDVEWVTNSFMINPQDLIDPNENAKDAAIYKNNRFASLTDQQYNDTSLGGSLSINVVPQFTRYADPRSGGLLSGRNSVTVTNMEGNYGMGRYYGEAIDENSTDVYIEFGFTKFNSTLFYLLSSVDYKTAVIANSGRSALAFNVGKSMGTLALMLAFPVVTIGLLITKTIVDVGSNLLANPGRFEHSYLQPQMFTYWSMVNTLATMMLTELGIVAPALMSDSTDPTRIGAPMQIRQEELDATRKIMKGLVTSGNAINVHAMVARGQMLHLENRNRRLKALNDIDFSSIGTDASLYRVNLGDWDTSRIKPKDLWKELEPQIRNNKDYLEEAKDKIVKDMMAVKEKILSYSTSNDGKSIFDQNDDGTYNREARKEDDPSFIERAWEVSKTVFNEGARYAIFRVEHLESTTETFTNTTTSVSLDDTINSTADKWRNIKFSLGNFNTGSDLLDGVTESIADIIVGTTDGLTLGLTNVIAGFLSGAKLESKKRWESSSVSLPTHTFKISLRSPSAHPIAQAQNLYIPLASLLAGVLPISTGPKSYTSPLNCNLFIRGRQRIEHGMITEVSITRGVTNLPYNRARRTLGLDITFKVVDFNETISAPLSSDILSSGSVFYNDESGINRYIQSLCSRDLFSATHSIARAKLKISKFWQEAGLTLTPEYWGAKAGDTFANDTVFGIFSNDKTVKYSELFK